LSVNFKFVPLKIADLGWFVKDYFHLFTKYPMIYNLLWQRLYQPNCRKTTTTIHKSKFLIDLRFWLFLLFHRWKAGWLACQE
jgi:hypothetical protein